jgi:transaldolase
MQIFLDTSNLREIQKWLATGVVDGVTTNPSIMLKEGVIDVAAETRAIGAAIGQRPLSVEVTTNDFREMLAQARAFAAWSSNIAVKIPIVNENGENSLAVINELARERVRVNVTAACPLDRPRSRPRPAPPT